MQILIVSLKLAQTASNWYSKNILSARCLPNGFFRGGQSTPMIYIYIHTSNVDITFWLGEAKVAVTHFKCSASFSVHRVLCFWELISFLQAIALTSRRRNRWACESCLLPETLSSTTKSRISQNSVHWVHSMLSVHPMHSVHKNVAERRTFHSEHTALDVHLAESNTNIGWSKNQRIKGHLSVKSCPLRSGSETPCRGKHWATRLCKHNVNPCFLATPTQSQLLIGRSSGSSAKAASERISSWGSRRFCGMLHC